MSDYTVNLAGVIRESIVDGPGIRFVVFTQGCPHRCPGCHNPETHEFGIGKDTDIDRILAAFDENPMLEGVTLSGGEPFSQPAPLAALAKEIHKRGRSVFCYSGWTFEELLEKGKEEPEVMELLKECDHLVDGRFVLELRDLSLLFRGSQNQRVLDVPKSLEAGEAIWDERYR